MRYSSIILFLAMLLGCVGVNAQNPYADGTSFAAGTTINTSPWSVAAGTTISGEGDITSNGNGTIAGTFNVAGDYTIPNNGAKLSISPGGRLEIFGNLYANSSFTVEEGAALIVHGNFISAGSAASNLSGIIVVSNDIVFSGVTLTSEGKLVVGGDVTINNAGGSYSGDVYALNPDALKNVPDGVGLIDTEELGDLNDFLTNESANSDLMEAAKQAGVISNVEAPTGFTFTRLEGKEVDLKWNLNTNGNSVIITKSESDLNDRPVDGSSYSLKEVLELGSEVIYVGSDSGFTYSGLTEGVTTYLRIWSFTPAPDYEYSIPVKLEVRALSSATIFYDGFEGAQKTEWTLGADKGNSWIIGNDVAYMGEKAMYISDNDNNAVYKKNVSTSLDLILTLSGIANNYKSVELSFYWKCMGEENADVGFVNGVDWRKQYTGQSTWVEKVIDITDLISGGKVSIPFTFVTNNEGGIDPGFCIDEVRVVGSDVAKPQSFSGVANSSSEVALEWTPNPGDPIVLIAYSSYGSIGRPESGKSYNVGDYLPGGGQVVYVGAATSTLHTGSFKGKLSYNIWSVTGGEYSAALAAEVNIPVELPYKEDFETDVDEWKFGVGHNSWYPGNATAYDNSSKSAYISYDRGFTAGFDVGSVSSAFMDVAVDLRGYDTALLSFQWKAKGSSKQYGEVYVNDTRLTSIDGRSIFNGETSWQEEVFSLNNYIGEVQTVRFRWYNDNGGQAEIPGFCIDDVVITGTIEAPASFTATNPNDLLNNLSWAQNTYGDEVMVAWSPDGSFGEPEPGVTYEAGDALPNGGTVLYLGDLLSYDHAPLNYGKIYYYKAWSHRNGIYSTGIEESANTPGKVVLLKENWDDAPVPTDISWSSTSISTNAWVTGSNAPVDGNGGNFAFISHNGTDAEYKGADALAKLSVSINLDELITANLTFDWVANGNADDYGEVYLNGTSIGAAYNGSTTWQSESINLDDYCGKEYGNILLEFVWVNGWWPQNNPGFCIDNIEVGGIYDPTSTITNGIQLSNSVASIANTQAEAVAVFSFDLTDYPSKYNDITRIQQLVVNKGADNAIQNWSDAIAGALLLGPDLPAAGKPGVITSGAITFTQENLILLENEGVPETYTFKIWLKKDLNSQGIMDGDVFDFAVHGEDMVTNLGDDFIGSNLVESGAVEIAVTATGLLYTQQPSQYGTMGYPLATVPEVSAVDYNGNIDVDFTGDITLSNSGVGLAMSPLTVPAIAGKASFANLTIGSIGGGSAIVTLSTASTDLTGTTSDEIQLDSYCIPSFSNNSSYVQQVMINTLDNTSGRDENPYAQYLDMETTLLIGKSYDVTVAVYNGTRVQRTLNIWIDWNDNGIFDNEEKFLIGTTDKKEGPKLLTGPIMVPENLDAVVGAHRMRVQFTDVATDACSGSTGEAEDYTVVLASQAWVGQNNLWDLQVNWSSEAVPDLATDVYIPEKPIGGAFPIIWGSAEMNNLEIANNASLTIKPGALVNIAGNITNSGDLVIENTIPEPASVITNPAKTIIGEATIRWTYGNLFYWFIGHSISNPSMVAYRNILNDPNQRYVLYDYKESGDIINMGRVAGFEFASGAQDPERLRGYQLKVLNPATIEHKGQLNNEPYYQKPVYTGTGWQIIANPYPAYYKLPVGTDDFAATDGSVYITKGTSNANKTFEIYNTVSEVATPKDFDGVIAPSQAFYIKTLDSAPAGAQITMRASQCTNVLSTPTLKSVGNSDKQLLRLYLTNEYGLTDEAVIGLYTNGELGINRQDSEQRMYTKTNYSYIYSVVDQQKMAINILPQLVSEYQQVLGVQTKPGKQKLRISGLQQLDGAYEVILEDKATQPSTLTLMDNEIEYEFTAEEGVFHDRFVLHFKPGKAEVPTDIDDVADESASVSVYVHNDATLKVNCKWEIERKTVEVYTISGSLLLNDVFEGEVFTTDLSVSPGVYIVKVRGEEQSYEQKLFIR